MRTTICVLILLVIAVQSYGAVTISTEKCEQLYAQLSQNDPWLKTECGSALAWGEAARIHGILDLYEVTGDTKYLNEVVRRCDQMLSHRDDKRGFKDYSGKTHKAWSVGTKYTIGEAALVGQSGKPVIRIRATTYAYNGETKVDVTSSGDAFTLHVVNAHWDRDETFADLSADPKNARYFEKIINNPDPQPNPVKDPAIKTSQLVKAIPIGMGGLPTPQSVTLKPLSLAYSGYLGIIYHPMLRFAELVKANPSLKEFAPAADRYIKAADESYAEFETDWRKGPGKDEGYYITCKRGGPFPYDNIGEPFNYLGEHVAAQASLYKLTGKAIYKDHIQRMANLFKNRLELKPGDLYVWYYWYGAITKTGWTKENSPSDNYPVMTARPYVEDVSHGTLDVQLVMSAERVGMVFDKGDIRRLANTFMKNVLLPDHSGFYARVDGTPGSERYSDAGVVGWLPLAQVNPAVYDACREVYEKRGTDSFTSLARLLLMDKRLH